MAEFTIPIKLDIGDTESEIKSLEELFNKFLSVAHTPIVINIDMSPVAQAIRDGFEAIPKAAQKASEEASNELSKLVKDIGQIGLGIGAIFMAFNKVGGQLRNFVNTANQSEKATTNLTSALRMQGEATNANIEAYSSFAKQIQDLTNITNTHATQLITLSVNYGISNRQRTEAVRGAIGLAKAFEIAGLSQEAALKGIALAYQGEWSQLQRYIPALRETQSETERLTILQNEMAKGFKMAQDETKTSAGSMQAFANTVSQSKEHIGDLINSALMPFVTVLTQITRFLNENPVLLKAVATGVIALAVTYTTLRIKMIAAKIAQDAFNVSAMKNPYILLGTVVLSVVAGIASHLTKAKNEIEGIVDTVDELRLRTTMPIFNPSEEVKAIMQSLKTEAETTQEAVDKMLADIEDSRTKNYDEIRAKYYDIHKSNIFTYPMRNEIKEMNKFYDDVAKKVKIKAQKDRDELSISELKETYDLSLKKRALGLITQEELITQANRYYNHISRHRGKDTAEYLEALAIKENAQKGLFDSEVRAIEQGFMSREQLAYAERDNQIIRFNELLQLKRIDQTQYNQFVASAEKKLQDDLLEITREAFMQKIAFEETKKQLGIGNVNELKQHINEYYEWAKAKYKEDTETYLEIYSEAFNLLNAVNLQASEESKKIWLYLNENVLDINPFKNQLDTQLELLQEYYNKAKLLLTDSQWAEMDMEKKFEKARLKLKNESFLAETNAHANALGDMGRNLMQFGGLSFAVGKAIMKAQALLQIPAAAFSAYNSTVVIPFVGPALAPIAAAAAIAVGLAQLQAINNTQPPKYEKGGLLKGASHTAGGIIIEAEGNEYITNKKRVAQIGTKFFDFINFAPIQQVRQVLSNIAVPPVFNLPVPSPIYATGGSVQNSNNVYINESILIEVVEAVYKVQTAVENIKLTVNNHISPNDIINNVDPETVYEIADFGKRKKGRF